MMTCKICSHADRRKIDAALVENGSLRAIASQFGIHRSSLDRHKKHIPKALTMAKQAETVAESTSLLSRLEKLMSRTEAIYEKAMAAGKWSGAAAAAREARGCLELLGKLSGELQSAGARVAINFGDITKIDITALTEEQLNALAAKVAESYRGMSEEELSNELEHYALQAGFTAATVAAEALLFDEETVAARAGGNQVCWNIRDGKAVKWTPYRKSSPSDRARMLQAAWKRVTGLELTIPEEQTGDHAAIVLEFDLADPRQEWWNTWPKVELRGSQIEKQVTNALEV